MLDECATAKVSSASHPHMVHGNYACVSVDGFNGANGSLFNNTASKTEYIEDVMPLNEEECIK